MSSVRDSRPNTVRLRCTQLEHAANARPLSRIVKRVSPTAADVAEGLYARWNDNELAVLTDNVHPDVELICDPLRPVESALRGIEGWKHWVARWTDSYEQMRITIDGLIPMSDEHVLALVTITATPHGGRRQLKWAAAHVWTVRNGQIARWEPHVDLDVARGTLL
jgi:ketosteroid isomerase-like protein